MQANREGTALYAFPYYNNYVDLARLELSALQTAAHPAPIESILFRRLKLTANDEYLLRNNAEATAADTRRRLRRACHSRLVAALRTARRIGGTGSKVGVGCTGTTMDKALLMTFERTDAPTVEGLAAFDVVFVAGLVGSESVAEKTRILAKVVRRCRPGALIVLRSAHGVRQLLYPEVDLTSLPSMGLRVMLVLHPWDHVVNSVVVCRVLGGAKL